MNKIWTLKYNIGASESFDSEQAAKNAAWKQLQTGEARHITHVESFNVKEPEKNVPPVDYSARCTTDGKPFDDTIGENGQQKNYVVLCDEERAKGFVRPVRTWYKHVGIRPKYPLRDLTEEEKKRYPDYAKYEIYPEGKNCVGRFWTSKELSSGCNIVTTMGLALAETYARAPEYYSGTFCCHCGAHFPVGKDGEFVWEDGTRVGT